MLHKSIKAERITRILAGRRINDSMAGYVADEVVKLMTRRRPASADSLNHR